MLLTSDNKPSTQASASPSLTERLGQVADRPSVRALRPLEDPAVRACIDLIIERLGLQASAGVIDWFRERRLRRGLRGRVKRWTN